MFFLFGGHAPFDMFDAENINIPFKICGFWLLRCGIISASFEMIFEECLSLNTIIYEVIPTHIWYNEYVFIHLVLRQLKRVNQLWRLFLLVGGMIYTPDLFDADSLSWYKINSYNVQNKWLLTSLFRIIIFKWSLKNASVEIQLFIESFQHIFDTLW